MVFKALNNTAGLNSLIPILLIFSVYPQITKLDVLLFTVIQRANAVKKAMAEIHKLYME